jgi:dienelactone hydrolase
MRMGHSSASTKFVRVSVIRAIGCGASDFGYDPPAHMRQPRLLPALLFLLPVVSATASGCDSADSFPPIELGPTARLSLISDLPDFMDVPFPSDVYRGSTGRVISIPGIDRVFAKNAPILQQELATMDGFSRIAPAMFFVDDLGVPNVDGEPAAATLDEALLPKNEDACQKDDAAVFFIDLEADGPNNARLPCRALFRDDRTKGTTRPVLAVGAARGVILAEGHRYAAVLTSRLRDTSGKRVLRGLTLQRVARGARNTPAMALYGAALDRVQALLGSALGTDEIVALAPFTTESATKELFQLRQKVLAAPLSLSWDAATVQPMSNAKFAPAVADVLPAGFTASLDDWLGVAQKKLPDGTDDPDANGAVRAHDEIAAFGTAVFQPPNFLTKADGGYDNIAHAHFARDAQGNAVADPARPTSKVWISIAIPKKPMPPTGYPVVMIQHGLSSGRHYMLSLANTFAKAGFISVAIDSVTFGARAADPRFQVDQTSDFAGAAVYKGPDGIADAVNGERNGPVDLFGSLKNIGALRDQMRQAALDTSAVVQLLSSEPDLSPLATSAGVPRVDKDRIAYIGDSLGGIQGALSAAIEDRVKAWFLNVAGGGIFTEIGSHGPGINAQLLIGAIANFGFRGGRFDEAHPFTVLGQTLAELGDPLAYAQYLEKLGPPLSAGGRGPLVPRNVIITEVIYDELVANEGGEALARAIGAGLAKPNVGSNAEIVDPKNPLLGPGKVKLTELDPGPDGIRDFPLKGSTAVLVQVSPAQHGADLTQSKAGRNFGVPYFGKGAEFSLSNVSVPCPYREMQAMALQFMRDAFDGVAPRVSGFPAPIRDFDGDGTPDATDPKVNDPNVK